MPTSIDEPPSLQATPATTDANIEFISHDLVQLTLTRENKAHLFKDAISKLDQHQAEAELILGNLTAWCPDVAALFSKRSSATVLDTPFRLIYPKDYLTALNNKLGMDAPQYTAISYCRHSLDFPDFPYPGYIKHEILPISKPFGGAILSNKGDSNMGIWIDQICIDQNNENEVQKAIAAMDVIYRSCTRLLVLLEDITLPPEEVQLHRKYRVPEYCWDEDCRHDPEDSLTFISFATKVSATRWFERPWCFHEFNMNDPRSEIRSRNNIHHPAFILNGPDGTTVEIKWGNLLAIVLSASRVRTCGWNVMKLSLPERDSRVIRADEDAWRQSIMVRHNSVAQEKCLVLADKVSIIINMCGLGISYTREALETTEEVLYISSLLALAAGELWPLSMMDGQTIKLHQQPTWLARHFFSPSIGEYSTNLPDFRLDNIRNIHSISAQAINLDLIFFRSIKEGERNTNALKLTKEVFPNVVPTTLPEMFVHESGIAGIMHISPENELDDVRRQFLAGCIINGMGFTARLWGQLKRDLVQTRYKHGVLKDFEANATLQGPAQKLVNMLGVFSSFDVHEAQLFLTWLTDPRSIECISFVTARMQCTIGGDEAFIKLPPICNEKYDRTQAKELRLAIPTALLRATCTSLRVWVLLPMQNDKREGEAEKWRIVGKAELLGEPDLMGEATTNGDKEGAVVKLKRSIVVG